jgi:hypothetical protein
MDGWGGKLVDTQYIREGGYSGLSLCFFAGELDVLGWAGLPRERGLAIIFRVLGLFCVRLFVPFTPPLDNLPGQAERSFSVL